MGKRRFDILKNFTEETDLNAKGVYMITHTCSNLKYVGSTTKTFSSRWKSHIQYLKRGKANKGLQNLYKKYGLEGFRFKILEKLDDIESIIRQRERYWIDYYDTYHNGANNTLDTSGISGWMKGRHYTEEEKQNIMLNSPTKKTVYIYSNTGELLYTFPSCCACDRFFGLKKKTTNWAINHPLRSICNKKYYPSYELKENWDIQAEINARLLERAKLVADARKRNNTYTISEKQKNLIRIHNERSKKVRLETLDGTLIKIFNSLNECDDYLEMTRGSTSKVIKGKAKTLKRKYIPILI